MKKITVILIVVATVIFTSCATKQSAISQLEQFSYELRDNSAYYNYEDWEKAVEKFGRLRRNINKHDYTPAERKRIGELEGQCAGYMVNGAKEGVINKLMGAGNEIKGILEGIMQSVGVKE